MKYKYPTEKEFEDIMGSFWIMLRECDTKAWVNNDTLLKNWVEGWYEQWNSMTGQNHKPMWK